MQYIRLDDQAVLVEVVREVLTFGYAPDEIDVVLSFCAPVDLDLLQQCIAEALEPSAHYGAGNAAGGYLAAA